MADTLVLYLLIGVIFYFILRKWIPFGEIWDWLIQKPKSQPKPLKGFIANLLRQHGYEPIKEKQKLPLYIQVDDDNYDSRIYIDFLAKKNEKIYVVITAKERRPLRYAGAALRDFFFAIYLLYQPAGILYINKQKQTVECITFSFTNPVPKPKASFPWSYVIVFVLGMTTLWMIQK